MPDPADKSATAPIPNKLYFRIGEVSRIVGVKDHVLRYWESEFPAIAPRKSGKGQRLFRRKDVETILEIKRLLYEKRYTIEGARNVLGGRGRPKAPVALPAPKATAPAQTALFGGPAGPDLSSIRKELEEILRLLS